MWASWPSIYNNIISNLDSNMATIGGVFYFQNGVNGSMTATSNTYEQCYTTTAGSIWYLPPGFYLSDTGSNYRQNCGL